MDSFFFSLQKKKWKWKKKKKKNFGWIIEPNCGPISDQPWQWWLYYCLFALSLSLFSFSSSFSPWLHSLLLLLLLVLLLLLLLLQSILFKLWTNNHPLLLLLRLARKSFPVWNNLFCSPNPSLVCHLSLPPAVCPYRNTTTMSSPSVQVQPQSSGGSTKNVSASSTNPNAVDSNFDIVRCSRCQRSMSLEKNESSPGIVRFGMNSYYCSRCASMVGFVGWFRDRLSNFFFFFSSPFRPLLALTFRSDQEANENLCGHGFPLFGHSSIATLFYSYHSTYTHLCCPEYFSDLEMFPIVSIPIITYLHVWTFPPGWYRVLFPGESCSYSVSSDRFSTSVWIPNVWALKNHLKWNELN